MNLTKRQIQIIESATELIGNSGIQELTIKNLAGYVGVSEAALYRHFDSKFSILETMLDFFYEQSCEKLNAILNSEEKAVKKLETLLYNQLSHFSVKPAIISVIYSEGIFLNEKRLSDKILKIMDSRKTALEKIIIQCQEEEEIRNDIEAQFLALTILGGVRLIILRWKISDYAFNLIEEGTKLVKAQLILIKPLKNKT